MLRCTSPPRCCVNLVMVIMAFKILLWNTALVTVSFVLVILVNEYDLGGIGVIVGPFVVYSILSFAPALLGIVSGVHEIRLHGAKSWSLVGVIGNSVFVIAFIFTVFWLLLAGLSV